MATQSVARLGDPSNHGGTLITATSGVPVDGVAIAVLGDLHSCPIKGHGITPMVTSSETVKMSGKFVVRVGDTAGCGATITTGSPVLTAG